MGVFRVWSCLVLLLVVPGFGGAEELALSVGDRFYGLFGGASFAAEYAVVQTGGVLDDGTRSEGNFQIRSPGFDGVLEAVLIRGEGEPWRLSWKDGPFSAGEVALDWVSTRTGRALGGRFVESRPGRPQLGLVALIGIECQADENPYVAPPLIQPQIVSKPGGTVESISSENGMASNAVRCLAQTPDGYLWVGTVEGLNRFDGLTWQLYGPDSTPRLPDTVVSDLLVDRSGQLIVGTKAEGIYRFSGYSFERFSVDPRLEGRRLEALVEGADGSVWCTLDRRDLAQIRPDGEVRTWAVEELNPVWAEHPFFPNNVFSNVLPINDQEVGVVVAGNVMRLNFETNHWRYERDFSITDGHLISGPTWDKSWFSAVDPRLTPMDASLPSYGLQPLRDLKCFPRRGGGLWVVYPRGIASFRDGVLTHYPDIVGPWRLGVGALEDREGTLWIFDGGTGLHRVRFPPVEALEPPRMGDRDEISLWTLAATGANEVTVSSLHSCFIRSPGKWEAMDPLLEASRLQLPVTERDGFDQLRNQVLSVDPVDNDKLWFGFASRNPHQDRSFADSDRNPLPLVASWDGSNLEFFDCSAQPRGVEWVHSIGISRSHGVFVATREGVFRKSRAEREFSSWNEALGVGAFDGFCVFVDSKDRVWIGGDEEGLYRLSGDVLDHWSTADGLAMNSVFSICAGTDEGYWVGTNRGLSRINRDGEVESWTTQAPFLSGPIYSILLDDHEHLWMGTPQGIVGVAVDELDRVVGDDEALLSSVRLGVADGLANANARGYYFPSACRTDDGLLWFVMEDGLVRFDPEDALVSAVGPEVNLQACYSGPDVYWQRDGRPWGEPVPKLRLPPDAQAAMAFDFHAVTFVEPRDTTFEARLVGVEEEWKSIGNQRQAMYMRLAPGDYHFQIRARNARHIPSPQTAEIAFSVAPYLSQTWSFRLGVAGLVIVAIYALHLWRMRYREQIGELEQRIALDQERSRIARDMHDDLGSTLARVRLRCEMAETLGEQMSDSLAQELKEVSRESMGSLRQIVWSLNGDRSEYGDVVQFLRDFVTGYFEGTGIVVEVRASEVAAPKKFSAAFKRDLVMLVKGISSNVLRHSQARSFCLEIGWDGKRFVVVASDDGVGISDFVESPGSMGLQSLRERAEAWAGALELGQSQGGGTRVRIELDPYVS